MQPAALANAHKPRVFRDPVHGLIAFQGEDAGFAALLDTAAMQRLRRVRQLGFASLVYPGAEHSRFGHALGTFHVAARVTSQLGMPNDIARHVKAAALLHDIGHGPFSHAWEEALGGPSHEEWGRRIVDQDEELRAALAALGADLPAAIDRFFTKTYRPAFARKLVSSQLDVDRMDYLLRDAHYSGVGYSTYDLDWVIHALRRERVRQGDDAEDLVVDYRRGLNALHQFLSGRFHMYAQVYYHKTVRAAEWTFVSAMRRFADLAREGREPPGLPVAARLARGEPVPAADFLALDDARVLCAFEDWAFGAADPTLADLAARFLSRRLFKTIEVADAAAAEQVAPALAQAASAALGERAGYYWAIDRASWLGYDPRAGEEIHVVGHPRHGILALGSLLDEMPIGRPSDAVRFLCAPELRERFAAIVAATTM